MTDIIASADGGNGAAPGAEVASTPVAESSTWYSGFDPDTSGWLENRGLTKLDEKAALPELVKGFRNAEKYIGTPAEKLLRLPDFDKADKMELDQFYSKLGRPADAKDYNLQVPEGQSREFADFAQNMFHEAGLSPRQAEKITAKWNEHVNGILGGEEANKQQALKDQDASLRSEWGYAYDKNLSIAKNAAQSIGLTPEKVDALESALGFDGVMKLMAEIGGKIGEAGYVTGDSPTATGPMTPNQAVAKLATLRDDKEWVSKYMNGNAEARAEMDRLMKMAYPT